jgi:chromodomain-helicase-DNA-binding protein 7
MLVVDEAHRMKNFNSKLCSTLREEFSYRHSLLLTGTPLQNNTEELWTLLHFVDREEFASQESFLDKYGDLKDPAQLESLQAKLKPYLLRRVKEHVERSVPPKEEVIIEVELTVLQKQYYRAIYEMNKSFLFRGATKDGPRLSNLAMELRKCCNHPFLVKGAEAVIREQMQESGNAAGDALIDSSGKLVLLDKLLPKLFAGGHRVLIFSQFRIMLDILEDYLHHRGYLHERIDGAITGHRRQAAIDRFSSPDSVCRVMLLSTRAGGVGINLTSADTVIIFDSDWCVWLRY